MNVKTRLTLARQKENGLTRSVELRLVVEVTNAARGDGVAGAIDKAMLGAQKAIDTTLRGTA